MVAAVDLAHQQAQTTPQFSLGQDGATIQQPVVTNAQDGVTSGGNQFKVNEYGVILGNVGTGGSVQARILLPSCPLQYAVLMVLHSIVGCRDSLQAPHPALLHQNGVFFLHPCPAVTYLGRVDLDSVEVPRS